MSKKKIVIASILKPLLDSRHYERFALSLAKTNKYEVNIIANGEKKPDTDHIRFYSNGPYGHQLIRRLQLQWSTCLHTIRLKPDLFIVCTVELLPFAFLYSFLTGCKVIYDVQENYTLNFKHLKEYGWTHRLVLAPLITGLEKLSGHFVDHYFLAEQCYEDQLNFINSRFTVLENKTALEAPISRGKLRKEKKLKFLFSGTISTYSGIYKIIELIRFMQSLKQDFEFTIIGQVIDTRIWKELQKIDVDCIHLKIDKSPVPHDQIIQEILSVDIGVIAYESQPVNAKKVPTKLFEYSAYGLPFLVEANSYWLEVGSKLGRALPFDFDNIKPDSLLQMHELLSSNINARNPELALWNTEELKLLTSIVTLLN